MGPCCGNAQSRSVAAAWLQFASPGCAGALLGRPGELAARRRLWGSCGDLDNRGCCLSHETLSLPAFMQVRGLTAEADRAPRPRLERGTYRLGGSERGRA